MKSVLSFLLVALHAASVVHSFPTLSSLFNFNKRASSANGVAIYWGQGAGQAPLSTVCANANVDIVILGFVNVFPDQGAGGWPGTNFGNACDGATYTNADGVSTSLLSNCPGIGPGIDLCHKNGKKVLLSLGGAYPLNYYLASSASAKSFANFLWGAFGPDQSTGSSSDYPRPFGSASVDGFDLDIESSVTAAQQQQYYPDLIAQLRTKYAAYTSAHGGTYYISGAPQCLVPDAHFSNYVQTSWFDYLFVQLYNTPQCSAAAQLAGTADNSWRTWLTQTYSGNSNVKIYAGLPASTLASTGTSSGASYYLTQTQVQTFVNNWYTVGKFAGIMLWDATYDAGNTLCGQDYAYWVKKALNNAGGSMNTACTTSTTSLSTSKTSTTSTKSSTTSTKSTTTSTKSTTTSTKPTTSATSTKSTTTSTKSTTTSTKSTTTSTKSTTTTTKSTTSTKPTTTTTTSTKATTTVQPVVTTTKTVTATSTSVKVVTTTSVVTRLTTTTIAATTTSKALAARFVQALHDMVEPLD